MKNKKIMIAIIIFIVVIVIAVGAFFLIKNLNDKSGKNNSGITFSGEEQNTSNTATEEKVETEYDENVPDNVRDITAKFVAAYMDENEMTEFISQYLDTTAYAAYEKIDGDNTKFIDTYSTITSAEAKQVEENFLSLPEGYKAILELKDEADKQLSNANATENNTTNETEDQNENKTENETNETGNETEDSNSTKSNPLDFEDTEIKLLKVFNYQEATDVKEITSVDMTMSWLGDDETLTMYFYDGIVIYLEDEDGNSVFGY